MEPALSNTELIRRRRMTIGELQKRVAGFVLPEAISAREQALYQEQLRNILRLNQLRLSAVGAFLLVRLFLVVVLGQTAWGGNLLLMAFYAGLALLVYGLSVKSDRTLLRSSLVVPFMDVPFLFMLHFTALAVRSNPQAVVGYGLGLFLVVIMLSALTLDRWYVMAATLLSLASIITLQSEIQASPAEYINAALLVVVVAILCLYARRRRVDLVANVSDEKLRRERLGRYFSPQVAADIEGEVSSLDVGRKCEITVLFTDIRDFTATSEHMDANDVLKMLREYHESMVDCIFANGGTLDKFIGDGIMAYFGAPIPQADHAERAVRCALAMRTALAQLNERRVRRGDPPMKVGMGIHSGLAVIGNIGSPQRQEYTAIGDTVNVASRIEGLTKLCGEDILISEETRKQVGNRMTFDDGVNFNIKGKTEPIRVFCSKIIWKSPKLN